MPQAFLRPNPFPPALADSRFVFEFSSSPPNFNAVFTSLSGRLPAYSINDHRDSGNMDLLYLALTTAFFFLSILLCAAFERL
jgi:hypothetical protein